ncbi:DNA primase [Treponema sp.]|uniref:DNA primase n=1 Tax=Treponema sp. TaxID=166 RepID=UPI00298E5C2B|nr:DNA primase [Treponema sp.]MCQ2241434.1 DNA primase [Treponema sp.]
MAGFISRESIEEVSNRTDIVQVVGERVQLTQKGRDWWGCCPFHQDKTPSFSVSPEKKFYYCFSCHATGTVIDFIKEMDKVSFSEAVSLLAKKAGVVLKYENGGSERQREDPNAKLKEEYRTLYTRMAGTFHYALMETQAGKFALDYIKDRGLTNETLEKFKIGYSPEDRFWLRKFLESKNYSKEFLDNSGLFNRKRPDTAFFCGRLMFPIFDRNGDCVAMGGRFLRGSDFEAQSKYKNSPELMHYKKGNILYAFNFAKESIRRNKKVIFCEGYMDCIAYHQCGIDYAVATLGTAMTIEHLHIVKPFVDEVLLSFDSDGAGQKATRRSILMCRSLNIPVRVVQLQGGKDPAEIMLSFGAEYLTKQVNGSRFDFEFLISKLQELYPKDTPWGKSKASLEYFEYIDSLQSNVEKESCLELFSQAYAVDKEALRQDYSNRENVRAKLNQVNNQIKAEKKEKIIVTAELQAVMTAVTDVNFFKKMHEEITKDDLREETSRQLYSAMEECCLNDSFSVSNILIRLESDELKGLLVKSTDVHRDNVAESVEKSICYLKSKVLENRKLKIRERIEQLSRSSLPEDKAKLEELLKQKMEVDSKIHSMKG